MKFLTIMATALFSISSQIHAIESLNKVPYAGLVLDKIQVDGVEISDFKFENGKKFIVAKPGEHISCFFNYEIDAEDLETLHLHHLIIGLHGVGPQDCAFSSLGIKDSKGSSTVQLLAPKKQGVYEVRAAMGKGITCESAKAEWNKKNSIKTVLGFVTVSE